MTRGDHRPDHRVVSLCLLLTEGVGGLATKSTTMAMDVDVDVEVMVVALALGS